MQHQLSLLAEFEHDTFADVDAATCHVLPGPVLLLQPEPWQLLLLQPALNPSAACAAAAGPQQPPAWQLSELHLPAESLLRAVAQDFQDVHGWLLASCAHSSKANGQPGSLTAAAPWQLLHSSCAQDDAGQLQLLLAMQVTCSGRHAMKQQGSVLLCMLHIDIHHMRTTPAGQVGEGTAIAWCQAVQWSALPACGVTFPRGDSFAAQSSWWQLVAVGSREGSLHVLDSSSSARSHSPAPAGLQRQWQQTHADGSAALYTAQLPGEIHSVVFLPHAHVSGVSHADVLAVLHNQHAGANDSSRQQHDSSMAVSFLRLHEGGQLQELAILQGVLGLCAPTHSALGLLCPVRPARLPQHQELGHAAYADGCAQRLAAVIIMDGSAAAIQDSNQRDGVAAAAGLGCHAWLAPAHAGSLPGPLLGILAAEPAIQQQQAGQAASTVTGTGATASGTTVRDSNELQGICSMLAVLEQRWQQGGCYMLALDACVFSRV
jgi:hypothetical protein